MDLDVAHETHGLRQMTRVRLMVNRMITHLHGVLHSRCCAAIGREVPQVHLSSALAACRGLGRRYRFVATGAHHG